MWGRRKPASPNAAGCLGSDGGLLTDDPGFAGSSQELRATTATSPAETCDLLLRRFATLQQPPAPSGATLLTRAARAAPLLSRPPLPSPPPSLLIHPDHQRFVCVWSTCSPRIETDTATQRPVARPVAIMSESDKYEVLEKIGANISPTVDCPLPFLSRLTLLRQAMAPSASSARSAARSTA